MRKTLLILSILSLFSIFIYGDMMDYEKAVFGGGCFWCMEPPFEKLDGVIDVISGYTGGKGKNPNYNNYESQTPMISVDFEFSPYYKWVKERKNQY